MEKNEHKCFSYFGAEVEKAMKGHLSNCWVQIWLFWKKNLQEILGFLIIPGEKKWIYSLKFGTRELKVVAPLINYQPCNTYFKERHKIPDTFNIVDMYLLLPKSKSLAARKQSKQTPKPHLPHVQCVLKIVVAHMSHISRTSSTGRFHTIWP